MYLSGGKLPGKAASMLVSPVIMQVYFDMNLHESQADSSYRGKHNFIFLYN